MAAKINMRLDKNEMPSQDPNVRNKNFLEVALGYTEEQALDEAARCLNCKNHPCVDGCPVNVRIPEFIQKIVEKDYEGAYQVIHQTSSLPAVCGRVCPQESQCEMHCVRGKKGDPVGIGRLERFVADWHNAHSTEAAAVPAPNGHKVAVIGSGPAGLTCAGDLAKKGYEVTVFEALHLAGGVLVYGIPEFRLPKAIVQKEVDGLKAMGVKVETNTVVGRTITIDELMEEYGFEAVFIGSGADAAEVQKYAKPLGSKCIFTGAISQRETLRAWYCRADLFLFPSSYDTNGLVVREAAACDLAAVLIDGSCAAEGVTDGVDGFLIDENAGSMAAKLQKICKRPECMAQVGCQAGDRLYLSWGDAVKRARERYGIVMENYRMGRYDDHHRPMDGVLNAQGSIMDALAKLRDLGDGLAERYREGWDEHREGIQERRDEFREEFQERLEEHREGRRAFRTELKQKGEALWQKLDRYL